MESTGIQMLTRCRISDVVRLEPFIASEVKLRRDLWRKNEETNRQRLENYVPTEASRKALKGILEGTSAAKTDRVHLLTGSYGTGKSYLLLVLANLLERDIEGKEVKTLIERVKKKERRYKDGLSDKIEQARNTGRYLVVVPDYAEKDFKRALLDALRRALEQEEIDYRPKTEYQRASDLIERWTDNENLVLDELKKRAYEDGTTLSRLKAEIEEDYQRESLKKVEEYYEDIMEVELPYGNIKIEETYKDVGKYIRKNHNLKGISILFDEFGNFLSEFVNQPDAADGQEIQDFIEFVKSVQSSRIIIVMAAHRSVADYAKGTVSQKDIEKVSGRFQEKHRLMVSGNFDEAEEMIYNTIVEKEEGKKESKLVKDRINKRYSSEWEKYLSAWYPNRDKNWRKETIALGCYPLHPATAWVLPKLSDRVGQSTRTMFKYMSPDEDGGVSSFVRENMVANENGRLQLLTIDLLYDYFLGDADTQDARGIEASQIKRRYTRARGNIQVEDPLAERLLKAMAILRIITDRELQSTGENLIWTLNLAPEEEEKAKELLDVLSRQGAIRKNKTTDVYKFRGAGEVSVDQIHQKYLREEKGLTSEEEIDIYRSVYDLEKNEVRPYGYNDKYTTNRKAVRDYLIEGAENGIVGKWENNLKKVYESGKGNEYRGNIVVLTGLAKSNSEKKAIIESYKGIEKNIQKYFVLCVSVVGDELIESAVEYEAARKTLKNEKITNNEDAEEEARHLLDEYEEALEKELKRELRPENSEWFYDGERKYSEGDLDKSSSESFIDSIISRTFNETPKISNNTIQHYPEGGDYKRKKRREAMNTLIERDEFSFEGNSYKENIIEGVLKPTKMFKKTNNRKNNKSYVRLRPPQDDRAAEVWKVLKSNLCNEGREARLQTAVRTLYHAPYGLSHPAVDMFLAAFVGYHSDEFTLREARRPVALSGTNLSKAHADPTKFSLRYQVLTLTQKRYLKEIHDRFGSDDSDGGLWIGAIRAVFDWYQQLPEVTKNLAPNEKSSIEKLTDPLSEADRNDSNVDEKIAKELLSEELPERFGFKPDSVEKNDSAKDDLIERINDARREAERFESSFAGEVLEDISYKAFGKNYSSNRMFKNMVEDWVKGIPLASKRHFKEEDSRVDRFLQEVRKEEKIVKIFLVKIPESWDEMTPYTKWTTRDERREYVDAVVDVVRKIENHQASPLPLLNRISQTAFDREVSSEEVFKEVVKDWFENLEPETRSRLEDGGFGDKSNALRKAIEKNIYRAGGSVVDHFLQYLPERLNISGGGWPNIPDQGRRDLAVSVKEAVQEVTSWKPPLSTSEMAKQLLRELSENIWVIENIDDPEDMLEEKSQKWYDDLPPAVDRADFDEVERALLKAIRGRLSVQEALETDIPDAVGEPSPSEAESAKVGKKIIGEVKAAFEKIDDWERPMRDLIECVGSEANLLGGSVHASDVTLNCIEWWNELDQKPQVSDFDSDTLAYHLVRWGHKRLKWENVLPDLIQVSSLPENYFYWNKEQDIEFADELNGAQERIEEWEPPKPSKEKIRLRIEKSFEDIKKEMNVSMTDIIEEAKVIVEKTN